MDLMEIFKSVLNSIFGKKLPAPQPPVRTPVALPSYPSVMKPVMEKSPSMSEAAANQFVFDAIFKSFMREGQTSGQYNGLEGFNIVPKKYSAFVADGNGAVIAARQFRDELIGKDILIAKQLVYQALSDALGATPEEKAISLKRLEKENNIEVFRQLVWSDPAYLLRWISSNGFTEKHLTAFMKSLA